MLLLYLSFRSLVSRGRCRTRKVFPFPDIGCCTGTEDLCCSPAEPAQESTAPQVAEASVEDKSAAAATSHAAPETASSDQPPPAEQDPPSAVPPEGAPSAADAATGQ